jgi:hypothetical protein
MPATADTLAAHVLDDVLTTFHRQKELVERALAQVDDADFFRTIDAESNSIAVLVKHVGGNLRSRWTDFLTADGEKPDRDRDGEFIVASQAGRETIMQIWNDGWAALTNTFSTLRPTDLTTTVRVRGESLSAVEAMHRSVAHVAQHAGQIVLLAKHYRSTDWKTLSIPRGGSKDFNTTHAATHR